MIMNDFRTRNVSNQEEMVEFHDKVEAEVRLANCEEWFAQLQRRPKLGFGTSSPSKLFCSLFLNFTNLERKPKKTSLFIFSNTKNPQIQ
jgi:hypothetical protein